MRRLLLTAALVLTPAATLAEMPPIPETPAAADSLLYAQHFSLGEGFRFKASSEKPLVTEGTIVIVEVDPALVYPREVAEPMIYIGSHPAQRLNRGYPEGVVIAFVPHKVDLTTEPIWFGTPELPERVDTEMARGEFELATAHGITPFPAAVVNAAHDASGLPLRAADVEDFDRAARKLYEDWILALRSGGSQPSN